jgi:hypothetical protein
MHYSEHEKRWVVQGSQAGVLEFGGSSISAMIKGVMKKFIKDNELEINGAITHSIYGIYVVGVK